METLDGATIEVAKDGQSIDIVDYSRGSTTITVEELKQALQLCEEAQAETNAIKRLEKGESVKIRGKRYVVSGEKLLYWSNAKDVDTMGHTWQEYLKRLLE